MTTIRDWMTGRSGLELFFINGLLWVLLVGLLGLFFEPHDNLIALAASGAIFGLFMTAITLSGRKRAGGADLMRAMNTAIRTGQLPPLFNVPLWTDKLESRRASLQRSVTVVPIFFGLIAVLLLLTAFISVKFDWANVILAGLLAGLATASTVSARGRIPKIMALQRELLGKYLTVAMYTDPENEDGATSGSVV